MTAAPPPAAPLLTVEDLGVTFRVGRGLFRRPARLDAVAGVSFTIAAGETLGVVGESGCGKSTLGRAVLRLIRPSRGRVLWRGEDLAGLDAEAMRQRRRALQIVFQDPQGALDPRMTLGATIAEPLLTFAPELDAPARAAEVRAIMARVGLAPELINRYPHEISGGQAQRVGIARAIVTKPDLVVCDEPVSALDVSIQAQIINLLRDLQQSLGLALLFISHDLGVVRHVSHRVLVLYLGHPMELAPRDALFATPRHPYTRALISAVPLPDPARERRRARVLLTGDPPSPLAPQSGCVFRTRCPQATERCAAETPGVEEVAAGHWVACHYV